MMFAQPSPERSWGASAVLVSGSSRSRLHLHPLNGSRPQKWAATDYLGAAAGFLLILAVTVINSRGRIFWEDEVLAWVLLRDPSWLHMIHAWNLGADGGGFTFYILARVWFTIFGSSELAFRLFSSTCFGLALVVTWSVLRRFYPTGIVALAVFNTMFFSPPLTMHYVEGRFYGLLVLNSALAVWLTVRLDEVTEPLPRRLCVLTFAVHSLLTTSHVLGVMYSAVLLLAMVLLDRIQGRRRPMVYMAAAASWVWLIPEKTALAATCQVGKPYFWTKAPTLGQVVGAYSGSSLEILALLVLLTLCVALTLPREFADLISAFLQGFRARRAIYVTAGCLLLVPICLLLEGTLGTWLFVDRYLQPVTLALAYVTAELLFLAALGLGLERLRQNWHWLTTISSVGFSVTFAMFLLFWVFDHMAEYTPAVTDFTTQLTSRLPHDVPVVVGDAFTFTELMSKQADSGVLFTFLLDWKYAISPNAPRLEVTQYHLMENWKRAGVFPGRVAYMDQFLREHRRFLVIDNEPFGPSSANRPERSNPIAQTLAATGTFEVLRYFTLDRSISDRQRDTVWLVCQGSCGSNATMNVQASSNAGVLP